MKTKLSNSCALLIGSIAFLLPLPETAHSKGNIEKRTYFFKEADKEMEYSLFVPNSYKKEQDNPLLVVLHGLGSNPNQVIRYSGITREAEMRGYVVVAPYGYNNRGCNGVENFSHVSA
jgi:poly(3-hydroxybutyrate) depolymerase